MDDYQWARVKYMSKTTTMEVSVELRSLLVRYPRANRSLPVPLRWGRHGEVPRRRQRAAAVLAVVGEGKVDGGEAAGFVQRRVHPDPLRPADEPRRRVRPLPQRVVEHVQVTERRGVPARAHGVKEWKIHACAAP
jgi:hypothetical protein